MKRITPPRGYKKEDTDRRRAWLAEKTGVRLAGLDHDDPENLKGIIENHIGYMKIPMAVTGPLLIKGTFAKGEYYVPLCTLEGTLTMSMTRGLYLTYLCGGIKTRHIKQELSRSPVFVFKDIDHTQFFTNWVEENFEQIKKAAESTTKHGKLLRIDKYFKILRECH